MTNSNLKFQALLGNEQTAELLGIFSEIEKGAYQKENLHVLRMHGLQHPLYMRIIRADMQSFVNTFIDPYLEKKPYLEDPQFVIDAGANIGYTAILFANWWPNCTIVSIEPDRENYELTLKNTEPYRNIKVINAALWNADSKLKIEAGQEDGFVVREIRSDDSTIKKENLTQGISIPQIMKSFGVEQIDFLKMNIEGSEKEVFSLNTDSWLNKTGAMLIELHDGKNAGCSKAVFSAIQNHQFAVAETAPYGILFVKEMIYRSWYARWYKEAIYEPNINRSRFPDFYLDQEGKQGVKEK